jgi:glycogen debranching enzyme
VGNICPHQSGLLQVPEAVVLAGLGYGRPWTRDAAINTWNGAGLLFPAVTRNTLLSTLERRAEGLAIGGQYWDAIIWAVGAWWQYLYSGDLAFLSSALEAVRNSLAYLEATEFDPQRNLFRGPAVYGDGVAAYPDVYARTGGLSSILEWPAHNPDHLSRPGRGLPMMALSTNCAYYHAYVLAGRMANELGVQPDPAWAGKAVRLKAAINQHFWRSDAATYRYLVGPYGGCDHQEGMGNSLAILFGVADAGRAEAVLRNQHVTSAGIPCVWPTYDRYRKDERSFGRHSGTVWPHIQGLWAHAAALHRKAGPFGHELWTLARHAYRDSQFAEIYHPITGEVYGGVQESEEGIREWASCPRQTWSATAFIRMVLMGLVGMSFAPEGVSFHPLLPQGVEHVHLQSLNYRDMVLDIEIDGCGVEITECRLNGRTVDSPFLSAKGTGRREVAIVMSSR